jgi:hypothetical protein
MEYQYWILWSWSWHDAHFVNKQCLAVFNIIRIHHQSVLNVTKCLVGVLDYPHHQCMSSYLDNDIGLLNE